LRTSPTSGVKSSGLASQVSEQRGILMSQHLRTILLASATVSSLAGASLRSVSIGF
jgi:hypothetical protein